MMWKKSDIRRARKVELAPLLMQRGIQLKKLADENFLLPYYYDLIVKKSYWIWPSNNLGGNAIDFFISVQGMSFSQTMKLLSQHLESIQSDHLQP